MFEILGVDKQMFVSCGQDEPYRSSKKAYFSHVIGLYFLSFFYEHPVDLDAIASKKDTPQLKIFL